MTAVGHSSECLKVDIIVHRASQLPELKTWGGDNRKFYVAIFDASAKRNKKQTEAIRSAGNAVNWDETLGSFVVRPSFQITLSLYAKHRISSDILIGTIKIDPISTNEESFTVMTSSGRVPVVVLTIHVHGKHRSARPGDDMLAGPSFEGDKPPSIPKHASATELGSDEQIVHEAQGALEKADDAVTGIKVCEEWEKTVRSIQSVMKMVKEVTDLHPYAKVAWTVISAIPEIVLKQFELDANIQALVKTMRETFDFTQAEDLLQAIKPNTNQALILKVMLKHITICTDFIQQYAKDKGFLKQSLMNITGRVSDKIKDLCDTLSRLRRDLLDNVIINMQIAVHLIQKSTSIMSSDIADLDFDVKVNDLPYKSGWSSTADKNGYLEGTRADFLEYILEWIKNPSSMRGLVLFGQVGTGKSSLAFEIASRFCFEEHPGSYFSFSRAQRSTLKDHHLFTTIIRDMSDHYPSFKLALGKLITNNTPLRTSDDFNLLFNSLLLEPLETIATTAEIPELIVIDGLDESADSEKLASFLSQSLKRLPQNFRVLITSRSEGNIEVYFRQTQEMSHEIHRMDDLTLTAHIDDDILLYFRVHLSENLFEKHGRKLVKKAEGLFQWAAIACGYLNRPPPGLTEKDCLRGLLGQEESDKPFTDELQSTKLYKLYDEVLSGYFTSDITRRRFCSVMGHLLAAFEPLSINTLTGLRQFVPDNNGDVESVLAVVNFLGSLLSNVNSDDRNMLVFPLHTSFRDYLVDNTDLHSFCLDLGVSHRDLAYACIDFMLDDHFGLKFNICELESSHLRNADVEDLQMRIENFISPPLFYACRFWDAHLDCILFDVAIFNKLYQFFSTKLLFWLEVLSITKAVPLAVQAIASTLKWLQKCLLISNPEIKDEIKALVGVVTDALAFVRYFGRAIATSAPHIYVSALSFTPKSSEVYKTYSPKFPATLSFIQGQLDYWPALQISISVRETVILSTDFSPDGQWIASGTYNGKIYLWNATTGIQEGSPLSGHTSRIHSIAFSSDGQYIISGSQDCTIRLWNVLTGTMEGNPWIGHEGTVNSIVFSPDGVYAVSGSADATIRIWKVANGSMEGTPLSGHISEVRSIAFSSDGKRIVSGSNDGTVRVWKFDKVKGQVAVTPLSTLHAPDWVYSVAISPNGQQIAAGCGDHSIYLWNALTEPTEPIPLARHTGLCVKFSPDGRHIVYVTRNNTLCLWSTSIGMVESSLLLEPGADSIALSSDGQRFVSHTSVTLNVWNFAIAAKHVVDTTDSVTRDTSGVTSVAYSHVGEQHLVAFGLEDSTILLWNVEKGRPFGNPLRGHTKTVHSVSFSPNGQQLVSGSADATLKVWGVHTGTEESTLIGHTGGVSAVAFSPDGQWIVSASDEGNVLLWNTSRGTEKSSLTGCSRRIRSVSFSPDGRQVVCGNWHSGIWVWDISGPEKREGRQLGRHESNAGVLVVSFVTNNQIVSFDDSGTVHYWSPRAGKIDGASFKLECDQRITSSTFSPDHSRLAVSFKRGTIAVWNLATRTWEELGPMSGHTDWISTLAFSPDGRQLVSGSYDSTIRVWDISRETTSRPELPLDPNLAQLNEDGWLVGKQAELLIWIPQHCRLTCRRPNNLVALFPAHQPHLDFSEFIHGKDWHTVYKASL